MPEDATTAKTASFVSDKGSHIYPHDVAYPLAVGQRFSATSRGRNSISLNEFFVIEGDSEDCLVILADGGCWGRISRAGLAMLCALDGLTVEEARTAIGIGEAEFMNLLCDPISWGMVEVPGFASPRRASQEWNTDFSLLVLKLTNRCNLDCKYCYNASSNSDADLSEESGIEIIRRAIDYSRTGLNIVFHGGEPFIMLNLMDRLCALAQDYATKQGKKVYFNVQTNATLLGDTALDIIERYDIGVGVSLDGPGVLNALRVDRADRATYDRAWSGINKLLERGHELNVITVITSQNAAHLYDLVLAFQELGVTSVKFSPFLRQGYGQRESFSMAPSPEAVAEGMVRIIDGIVTGEIHDIRVEDICDMIRRCLSLGGKNICHRAGPCGAGRDMITVFPNCDVFVCDCLVHEEFLLGRIDGATTMQDLVKGEVITNLNQRHPARLKPCNDCAIAHICGGTMTCRAFWSNGNIFTVDTAECQINQRTILALLWKMTECRALIDYFLRWERLDSKQTAI